MSSHRVLLATFHAALARAGRGLPVDEAFLAAADEGWRQLRATFPEQTAGMALDAYEDEPPDGDLWQTVEVELDSGVPSRRIGPLAPLVEGRLKAVHAAVRTALAEYADASVRVVDLLASWMRSHSVVHVIGSG